MRVKVDQLGVALQKSLLPVYLISGDEPLQLAEAADEIRHAAKQAGYTSREVIAIDSGNEWYQLAAEAESLSIFSDKKLIDLRLPSAKPGVDGSKILINYCKKLPEETILLITAGKLETAALKSQWFQTLDHAGVIVQVWPLQGAELQHWLQRRTERKGMHFETEALKSLAARIEGNLLAAAQEIEKLYILHGQSRIHKALVENDVVDCSRFDVFKLIDALLIGKLNRAVKIMNELKAEGIAAPVVLWALSREARSLFNVNAELKQGTPHDVVFKNNQIWDKRKQMVQEALTRLKPADVQNILQLCAKADQQIKGQAAGDGWDSLFEICLLFVKCPMMGLNTQ